MMRSITTIALPCLFIVTLIPSAVTGFVIMSPLIGGKSAMTVTMTSSTTQRTNTALADCKQEIRDTNPQARFSSLTSSVPLIVSYEGTHCEIFVRQNETILSAMERHDVMDQLCLPQLPSDCRRGNCMTCAGRLVVVNENKNPNEKEEGTRTALRRVSTSSPDIVHTTNTNNGLSPHVSDLLQSSDYVLTCCTYITGDNLPNTSNSNVSKDTITTMQTDTSTTRNATTWIELGQQDAVWKEFYQTRFLSDDAVQLKRETVAKVLRVRAESNVPRWKVETEEILRKNTSQDYGCIIDDEGMSD